MSATVFLVAFWCVAKLLEDRGGVVEIGNCDFEFFRAVDAVGFDLFDGEGGFYAVSAEADPLAGLGGVKIVDEAFLVVAVL